MHRGLGAATVPGRGSNHRIRRGGYAPAPPSMDPFVTNRGPLVSVGAPSLQGIPVGDLLLTRESEGQMSDLAGNAMTTTVVGAACSPRSSSRGRARRGRPGRGLLKKDEALRMSAAGKSWATRLSGSAGGAAGARGLSARLPAPMTQGEGPRVCPWLTRQVLTIFAKQSRVLDVVRLRRASQ